MPPTKDDATSRCPMGIGPLTVRERERVAARERERLILKEAALIGAGGHLMMRDGHPTPLGNRLLTICDRFDSYLGPRRLRDAVWRAVACPYCGNAIVQTATCPNCGAYREDYATTYSPSDTNPKQSCRRGAR